MTTFPAPAPALAAAATAATATDAAAARLINREIIGNYRRRCGQVGTEPPPSGDRSPVSRPDLGEPGGDWAGAGAAAAGRHAPAAAASPLSQQGLIWEGLSVTRSRRAAAAAA